MGEIPFRASFPFPILSVLIVLPLVVAALLRVLGFRGTIESWYVRRNPGGSDRPIYEILEPFTVS